MDISSVALISEPLEGHTHFVTSVNFSPSGSKIVSSSLDNTVQFWDALTGSQIGEPLQHLQGAPSLNFVAFSPNETKVVFQSQKGTLHIWQSTGEKTGKLLKGHSSYVHSVFFSPMRTI
jgi:WD40 repeat protein